MNHKRIFSMALKKKSNGTAAAYIPHILLIVFVVAYVLAGAGIFLWLEGAAHQEKWSAVSHNLDSLNNEESSLSWKSNLQLRDHLGTILGLLGNQTNSSLLNTSLTQNPMELSYGSAVLFAFSLVTTIGYGHVSPLTTSGMVFSVLYSLLGIPLTLLCIGNISRFLTEMLLDMQELIQEWSYRYKNIKPQQEHQRPERIPAICILALFVLWVAIGSLFLPLYENVSIFEATYFNIISLTTIGLGDIVPQNWNWLPLTCLYLTLGLIITSLTIEVFAEYLRRLHYIGKKVRRIRDQILWFGNRKTTVKGLVMNVLTGLAVPEDIIADANANMESILRAAVENRPIWRPGTQVQVNSILPVPDKNLGFAHGMVTDAAFAALMGQTIEFMEDEPSSEKEEMATIPTEGSVRKPGLKLLINKP